MRALLHLLSVVLVLPGALLAAAFIILGRAIATHSLLGILWQLLSDALWLFPWGLLGSCAIVLAIAIAGLFAQARWLAGSCVAILGIASTVVLLMLGRSSLSLDELPFLSLGLAGSVIGLWFAYNERARTRRAIASGITH